jgi:hypothetical protein
MCCALCRAALGESLSSIPLELPRCRVEMFEYPAFDAVGTVERTTFVKELKRLPPCSLVRQALISAMFGAIR